MYRERPLFLPFLAFSFGLYLSDSFRIILPLSAVAALSACLVLACLLRDRRPFNLFIPLFFLVCGLRALAPWHAGVLSQETFLSSLPVRIEGVVVSRPSVAEDGGSFVLQVDRIVHPSGSLRPANTTMQVFVSSGGISLRRGDRILLSSRITAPHLLGLPGEFDYGRYLAYGGISAVGRVESSDEIVILQEGTRYSFLREFDLVARRLGEVIRDGQADNDASAVLCALLLGDQKRISESLAAAYTRAGVNHILSVSGFHVGIIAFFLVQSALLVLTRIERIALAFNLRRTVLLMALPVMVIYLLLTGAAPATARSVIMLAALVLALYAERETDPLNTLLFSAMLLLCLHPPGLFDPSFQLSFLAMWGIVVLVPVVMERCNGISNGLVHTIVQFTATSCAASLVTMVPVLFLFNQASLNGILTNFLIVPLLGYGAVIAGFCALPLAFIWMPACHLLLWPAGMMVKGGNALVLLFSHLPVISFSGITRLDMFLFLAALTALSFMCPSRIRTVLCCMMPICAVAIHLKTPSGEEGMLRLTMLSVGQAESMLIRLPDGKTMLVDGGGYLHETGRDFGERVVVPALRTLGVRRIDWLVLTHGHPDHCGGMPFLIMNMPVGEFWFAGSAPAISQELKTSLVSRSIPQRNLIAGTSVRIGSNVIVEILAPSAPSSEEHMDLNDESLIIRLVYGGVKLLLTADAGMAAEEKLLRRNAPLQATLLKVGHHGSRHATSDDFLERVMPKVALISAGRDNRFGLPSRQTLERLRLHGIPVFRTDLDGTIDFITDGRGWRVETYSGRK